MYVIGLTGGIASGKTTVANLFAKQGVEIIDTDIIAREIVEVGQPAWQAVINHFGNEICLPDGTINRKQLRHIVFTDENEKTILENILHPIIRQEVNKRIAESKAVYCIVIIPLLFETKNWSWLNRILVVDIPEDLQVERLCDRDNISLTLAHRMLQSQVSRQYRLEHADDVIDNSKDVNNLNIQVLDLDKKYRLFAKAK